MDIAYRLILYIIMANVGYMIFSLFRKGFRHYSGYISQLFFLLCLMVLLLAKDVAGGISIGISLSGIFLIVLLPMFLQRQIDVLMAENRLSEIEPLARWKAHLAWSELNVHLHKIARVAHELGDDPHALEQEIRKLLDRGEPYDSMTRVFIGLIHFNNRNFEGMVRDLVVEGKSIDDYNFEELLYLVRAYLELTRFPEAIEAQLALERKLSDPEDFSPEKQANLVISRMIFFAFLGWREDLERLLKANEEGIERLPSQIRDFWRGVCVFNSGDFSDGEQIMGAAMRACESNAEDDEEEDTSAEAWLPFMRKRFFGLVENREFMANRLLVQMKKLEEEHAPKFNQLVSQEKENLDVGTESSRCTDFLVWTTLLVSVGLMMTLGIEDLVTLIKVGANSAFLVNQGEFYRLFTSLFIHIGWVHLFMNVLALRFFGPPVENVTGWPLFLGIYFFSGFTGSLAAVYAGQTLSAGASSAVLGLLSAAIVLEFFRVRGAEKLAGKNNFSTLIFILVINLVIGSVEQGVDNSAHLGGLAGGALLSLILVPLLPMRRIRKLAGVLAVLFVMVFAGYSLVGMGKSLTNGTYPEYVNGFHKVGNASQTIELELPNSWKMDEKETDFRELAASGPFREKFTAFVGINEQAEAESIKEHVNQRTAELEKTPELTLRLRKGPDLIASESLRIYQIKWMISSGNGPLTVVDYLVFDEQLLFLLRFFIGSENEQAYEKVFSHAIKTFRSPFFEVKD